MGRCQDSAVPQGPGVKQVHIGQEVRNKNPKLSSSREIETYIGHKN